MTSCRKTTELIEKRAVASLSIKEKMQLTMHTAMCTTCKAYAKQSKLLEKALSKFSASEEAEPKTLSDEAKLKIKKQLESS